MVTQAGIRNINIARQGGCGSSQSVPLCLGCLCCKIVCALVDRGWFSQDGPFVLDIPAPWLVLIIASCFCRVARVAAVGERATVMG